MDNSHTNKKVAFVALVPVVHTLYLDLFKKYPDNIYILGESVLEDWEEHHKMTRDLRRIDQEQIRELIANIPAVKIVKILEKDNLSELDGYKIVLPKEDVSQWVASTYFNNHDVEYENIFLRWNRPVSTQELEIDPDRQITEEEFHREIISQAEEVAQKSPNWWRQVGVLALKDGKVVAEGFNKDMPSTQNMAVYGDLRMCFDAGESYELSNTIHGEAALIAGCAKRGISLDGADLYVTTYPCPTCAKLIGETGIKRVFYKDGYSLSDAEDILKGAGVEIILVR